jgi:hypothetical protein
MTQEERPSRTVVSARGARWAVLLSTGLPTILSVIILGLYIVMPGRMGPSPERPHATSLLGMIAIVAVASFITGMASRLIAREVSLEGDSVVIIKGSGERIALRRAAIQSLGSIPMGHWYFVWLNVARGEEIRRVLFFSLSPHPVRLENAGSQPG